jgi:hypothetical protein
MPTKRKVKLPSTSPAPSKLKRTSPAPSKPPRPGNKALERAKQKLKIRNQKEEIDKLKRSLKARDTTIVNLQKANDYLSKSASDGEGE